VIASDQGNTQNYRPQLIFWARQSLIAGFYRQGGACLWGHPGVFFRIIALCGRNSEGPNAPHNVGMWQGWFWSFPIRWIWLPLLRV